MKSTKINHKSVHKVQQREKETLEKSYKLFIANNNIDYRDNLDDSRLENFEDKIDSWLSNVETEEEKEVFLNLLKNYKYYNKLSIADSLRKGYEKFKQMEPYHNDTIFMGVGSRGGIYNGSSELMPVFKRINNIDKLRIADKPKDFHIKYDPTGLKNIVLVDDIIGSGTTVKRYIEENLIVDCPELVLGKRIYVVCVIALPKGLEYLKKFSEKNNIFISVIHEYSIEKTFDVEKGLYNNEKERVKARRMIKKYDTRIAKRRDDILGFKGSQGLVSFYHNTPNNTFPIFWENNVVENDTVKIPWSPLFERDQGVDGLPERSKPSHESLNTIINEKNFKDKLLSEILNELNK